AVDRALSYACRVLVADVQDDVCHGPRPSSPMLSFRASRTALPISKDRVRRFVAGASWCHNGTMKRMNLRDVPDDVYAILVQAAESNRQSLSAFVVERLTEVVQVLGVADYVESYVPPRKTGVSLDDAVDAVREARHAS